MGRRLVKQKEFKEFTKKIISEASIEDLPEYINGSYTKCGTSPMNYEEEKIDLLLPNRMIAVFGVHPEDGISCDKTVLCLCNHLRDMADVLKIIFYIYSVIL